MPLGVAPYMPPRCPWGNVAVYGPEERTGGKEHSLFIEARKHLARGEFLRLKNILFEYDKTLASMAKLSKGWDTYDANPPSEKAISAAKVVLKTLVDKRVFPSRVAPSVEGGIAIFFVEESKYADIECLNSDEVLAVTYTGKEEPTVWEIRPQDDIDVSITRIAEYLRA